MSPTLEQEKEGRFISTTRFIRVGKKCSCISLGWLTDRAFCLICRVTKPSLHQHIQDPHGCQNPKPEGRLLDWDLRCEEEPFILRAGSFLGEFEIRRSKSRRSSPQHYPEAPSQVSALLVELAAEQRKVDQDFESRACRGWALESWI